MRFIKVLLLAGIMFALPIGSAAYGANEISNAGKLDVVETVLRQAFQGFSRQNRTKYVFLILGEEYQGQGFLDRFKNHNPPVRGYSGDLSKIRIKGSCGTISIDPVSGQEAQVFQVTIFQVKSDDEIFVRVQTATWCDTNLYRFECFLKNSGGVWAITKEKAAFIHGD